MSLAVVVSYANCGLQLLNWWLCDHKNASQNTGIEIYLVFVLSAFKNKIKTVFKATVYNIPYIQKDQKESALQQVTNNITKKWCALSQSLSGRRLDGVNEEEL